MILFGMCNFHDLFGYNLHTYCLKATLLVLTSFHLLQIGYVGRVRATKHVFYVMIVSRTAITKDTMLHFITPKRGDVVIAEVRFFTQRNISSG